MTRHDRSTDVTVSSAIEGTPITGERVVETYPGSPGEATVVDVPARDAATVPARDVLEPSLAGPLDHELYAHQAEALDALARDENVCVATSTASGKTLIYGLQIARHYLAGNEESNDTHAGRR